MIYFDIPARSPKLTDEPYMTSKDRAKSARSSSRSRSCSKLDDWIRIGFRKPYMTYDRFYGRYSRHTLKELLDKADYSVFHAGRYGRFEALPCLEGKLSIELSFEKKDDQWTMHDPEGNEVATITDKGIFLKDF